ncbi:MAG TPA: FtsX-like permease family protein [Saprospiraceae bacterium]|nr:FtsX-like permease family protein [Saprospiraceae bacterium]
MNLPLLISRRYLFARRSTNAINIITGISVLGMAIGTAALVLVLSVFNGFEDLLSDLFGHFNPPLKITAAKGKTFEVDSIQLAQIRALPGVEVLSQTLEEIAFFEHQGSQDFGVLKGVDDQFALVNGIDSDTTLIEGKYLLQDGERNCLVLGAGVRNKLSVNVENPLASVTVYMPEQQSGFLDKPFKTRLASPVGTFAIQQEFDSEYVLSNIDFVRELLESPPGAVSALEIKTTKGAQIPELKARIQAILGDSYVMKDRYEQNEAFFKVMQLEKWMGFAITSLMLLLMAFNTVGALWMIVLDKQRDISTLKSMGATDGTIRRIFLLEGLLLTLLGMVIGLLLAIILYVIQKQHGIVTIPEGFLVDSYPIAMRATDFIPITLTVLGIGLLASILPARRAAQVPAFLREE